MLVRFNFLLTEYYGWNRSGAFVNAMALNMLKYGCLLDTPVYKQLLDVRPQAPS